MGVYVVHLIDSLAPPLEGLGERPDMIKKLLRDDPDTLTLFEQACVGKHGTNQHSKKQESSITTVLKVDRGKAYTLGRLAALYKNLTSGVFQSSNRKVPNRCPQWHKMVLYGTIRN